MEFVEQIRMVSTSSMAAAEEKAPIRNDTPSFSLRQRPQKKMLSMEEEFKQIRKCRKNFVLALLALSFANYLH